MLQDRLEDSLRGARHVAGLVGGAGRARLMIWATVRFRVKQPLLHAVRTDSILSLVGHWPRDSVQLTSCDVSGIKGSFYVRRQPIRPHIHSPMSHPLC